MVISILIGALYDEWTIALGGLRYSLLAHLLGVSGEVCGGVGGYAMSFLVGREILLKFAAEKMGTLQTKMREYEGSLFRCARPPSARRAAVGASCVLRVFSRVPRTLGRVLVPRRYMLFLRVSPMLPNWFVNYGTPLVDMPLSYFVAASLIAIQPAAAMSIAMGAMVREAGEAGLDLATFARRGAAMACTTFALSLPLIPAGDMRAAADRVRRSLGMRQSQSAARS